MTDEQKTADAFFEHLRTAEQPTGLGLRWVRRASQRILAFAEVAPGSRILEIGPGRGEFAELCLGQKMEYHAIEPNAGLAESLRQKGANVLCARVPPLPALDRKFDLAVMVNVMEHMNGLEQALDIACQIRRVLNPGGKFLIHAPDLPELARAVLQLRLLAQLRDDAAPARPASGQCGLQRYPQRLYERPVPGGGRRDRVGRGFASAVWGDGGVVAGLPGLQPALQAAAHLLPARSDPGA